MLYAKHLLTEKDFHKAKSKGAKIFLYNEITFIPDESSTEFYNCSANRGASTWLTWEENEKAFASFVMKFPGIFTVGGVNLDLACMKALFWANLKNGYLNYTIKNLYPDEKVLYADQLFHANKIKVLVKTVLRRIREFGKNKKKIPDPDVKKSYRYALHIRDNFQLGLYKYILHAIKDNKEFKIFADKHVDFNLLNELPYSNFEYIPDNLPITCTPRINLLKLKGSDWFVWHAILTQWDEISNAVQIADCIRHPNLKAVLLNEAENGPYGAAVSEVLTRSGVVVFNTMNGMKAGQAQDAHINFDKWFVWDEHMKNMMLNIGIPEKKLLVSGHLVQDAIREYEFSDSLGIEKEFYMGKKVISMFSVKGKIKAKFEAMNILREILLNSPDYVLFIRPHPSEGEEDYLEMEELENVRIVRYSKDNQHESLHDQLKVSDLSVVFGSTVGIESKWMNVPCITFEERENSLIYCADNQTVFHVKDAESFKKLFLQLLNREFEEKKIKLPWVSEIIIQNIKTSSLGA